MGLVTLKRFQNMEEAHLVRSRLEGSGIDAVILDENTVNMDWLYSNAIGGIRLCVHEGDAARARDVLGFEPMRGQGIQCPLCGSGKVTFPRFGFFNALVMIFAGFFFPRRRRKVRCSECGHVFEYQPAGEQTEV